jgi:hypothetical protein
VWAAARALPGLLRISTDLFDDLVLIPRLVRGIFFLKSRQLSLPATVYRHVSNDLDDAGAKYRMVIVPSADRSGEKNDGIAGKKRSGGSEGAPARLFYTFDLCDWCR